MQFHFITDLSFEQPQKGVMNKRYKWGSLHLQVQFNILRQSYEIYDSI